MSLCMDSATVYATLYGTVFGGVQGGRDAVELSWQNLTVKSKRGRVRLLKDVCGSVKGRLLAVMGPSGSGKTTFLNQLAVRGSGMEKEGGSIRVEGREYGRGEIKKISGYVMQHDVLFERLTVLEVLTYAARLKMHPKASAVDRRRRVDKVLKLLGLQKCKDVMVGGPMLVGISGGQLKRLAVGVELLTRPKLLFLDEPTSGLDSVSALELFKTLRSLAHKEGVTVITTVHQPSSRVFELFDDLLVLCAGTVLFHGPAKDMLAYYAAAGLPSPPNTNPADWALDAISTEEGVEALMKVDDDDDANEYALEQLLESQTGYSVSSDGIQEKEKEKDEEQEQQQQDPEDPEEEPQVWKTEKGARLGWGGQMWLLLQRASKLTWRDNRMFFIQIIQTFLIAVMIGTVFLQLPPTVAYFGRRSSAIFFCCINQGIFGALMTINLFPVERVIIMRERQAGMYYVSAYFVSKMIVEIVASCVFPLVFTCTVYWLIGLYPAPGNFFIFLGFMELCYFGANSVAVLISCAAGTVLLSAAVLPMALEIARLFGGFFMPPVGLPLYFSWLDAISYVKYAYMGLMMNEFQSLNASCSVNGTTIQNCVSGQTYLDSLGINYMPMYACALVLLGICIACRFAAYLILRFRP